MKQLSQRVILFGLVLLLISSRLWLFSFQLLLPASSLFLPAPYLVAPGWHGFILWRYDLLRTTLMIHWRHEDHLHVFIEMAFKDHSDLFIWEMAYSGPLGCIHWMNDLLQASWIIPSEEWLIKDKLDAFHIFWQSRTWINLNILCHCHWGAYPLNMWLMWEITPFEVQKRRAKFQTQVEIHYGFYH